MDKFKKLNPGTKLKVGTHECTIVKYISEGGFAHIYEVKISPPENDSDIACLKRVLVKDRTGINQLRTEVKVMQKLVGCPNIVQYYDSHASRLSSATSNESIGYEVLVLMELCPNRSLLDFMNTRLKTKLKEIEIIKIMYDISLAVSQLHYLPKPLIHRDIKIENVLIDSQRNFKLCDFGSTTHVIPPPKDQQQFESLYQDILHQTTPQYRCPEMIDLRLGFPIDEKSDIWALGVFLYKLCYYTTPFEVHGQAAILSASFQIPPNPRYSYNLMNLIIIMLQANPKFRPNIYQVVDAVCKMCNLTVPIHDKYEQGPYKIPPPLAADLAPQQQLHPQHPPQALDQQQVQQQQPHPNNHHQPSPLPQVGQQPYPPSQYYQQPHKLQVPQPHQPQPHQQQYPPTAAYASMLPMRAGFPSAGSLPNPFPQNLPPGFQAGVPEAAQLQPSPEYQPQGACGEPVTVKHPDHAGQYPPNEQRNDMKSLTQTLLQRTTEMIEDSPKLSPPNIKTTTSAQNLADFNNIGNNNNSDDYTTDNTYNKSQHASNANSFNFGDNNQQSNLLDFDQPDRQQANPGQAQYNEAGLPLNLAVSGSVSQQHAPVNSYRQQVQYPAVNQGATLQTASYVAAQPGHQVNPQFTTTDYDTLRGQNDGVVQYLQNHEVEKQNPSASTAHYLVPNKDNVSVPHGSNSIFYNSSSSINLTKSNDSDFYNNERGSSPSPSAKSKGSQKFSSRPISYVEQDTNLYSRSENENSNTNKAPQGHPVFTDPNFFTSTAEREDGKSDSNEAFLDNFVFTGNSRNTDATGDNKSLVSRYHTNRSTNNDDLYGKYIVSDNTQNLLDFDDSAEEVFNQHEQPLDFSAAGTAEEQLQVPYPTTNEYFGQQNAANAAKSTSKNPFPFVDNPSADFGAQSNNDTEVFDPSKGSYLNTDNNNNYHAKNPWANFNEGSDSANQKGGGSGTSTSPFPILNEPVKPNIKVSTNEAQADKRKSGSYQKDFSYSDKTGDHINDLLLHTKHIVNSMIDSDERTSPKALSYKETKDHNSESLTNNDKGPAFYSNDNLQQGTPQRQNETSNLTAGLRNLKIGNTNPYRPSPRVSMDANRDYPHNLLDIDSPKPSSEGFLLLPWGNSATADYGATVSRKLSRKLSSAKQNHENSRKIRDLLSATEKEIEVDLSSNSSIDDNDITVEEEDPERYLTKIQSAKTKPNAHQSLLAQHNDMVSSSSVPSVSEINAKLKRNAILTKPASTNQVPIIKMSERAINSSSGSESITTSNTNSSLSPNPVDALFAKDEPKRSRFSGTFSRTKLKLRTGGSSSQVYTSNNSTSLDPARQSKRLSVSPSGRKLKGNKSSPIENYASPISVDVGTKKRLGNILSDSEDGNSITGDINTDDRINSANPVLKQSSFSPSLPSPVNTRIDERKNSSGSGVSPQSNDDSAGSSPVIPSDKDQKKKSRRHKVRSFLGGYHGEH